MQKKKPKILIVDDEPANIYLLKEILTDASLLSALNGDEMWEILKKEIPDLILLDIMMPGMDGYEIANRLSSESKYKDIPVIFISAKSTGKDIAEAFKSGGMDYIKKPIDEFELLARIESILKRKEENQLVKEQAITDSLTGTYNRRYLENRLNDMVEMYIRNGTEFSLSLSDIDFFKKINDTYGHQAGDFILKKFTDIIKLHIRPYDILARYGGEEFIIIFPKISKDIAMQIMQRIKNNIEFNTFNFNNKQIQFRFSCGISDTGDKYNKPITSESITKIADSRLYYAKDTGRNKIVIK